MIQQVGGYDKVGGNAGRDAAVGGGYGQMGFAAAAGASEHQPTGRFFGKGGGGGQGFPKHFLAGGVGQRPFGTGIFQGDAAEGAQVAVAVQDFDPIRRLLPLAAAAGESLAKIGMADRGRLADPAGALADGTRVGRRFLGQDVGQAAPNAAAGSGILASGDPAENVAQAFHFQSSLPAKGRPRL